MMLMMKMLTTLVLEVELMCRLSLPPLPTVFCSKASTTEPCGWGTRPVLAPLNTTSEPSSVFSVDSSWLRSGIEELSNLTVASCPGLSTT
ncbi:hypothetical protein E2C01_013120 [Portunus trituberculatus]|uniref:Secreted protein n=1 Tax=Portunus trituberculatus TaxID=210409 RepID=A0A5B7DFT4_PORTR|nr:hypothetical protein [Portunus trituberculatus]